MSTPPRWDMSNVYPSLESKEFEEAVKDYKKQAASLENFFDKKISTAAAKTPTKELAALVGEAINRFNKIQTLSNTIGAIHLRLCLDRLARQGCHAGAL